jgi:hypothetical protein
VPSAVPRQLRQQSSGPGVAVGSDVRIVAAQGTGQLGQERGQVALELGRREQSLQRLRRRVDPAPQHRALIILQQRQNTLTVVTARHTHPSRSGPLKHTNPK